jgi:hypothetical protein
VQDGIRSPANDGGDDQDEVEQQEKGIAPLVLTLNIDLWRDWDAMMLG